MLKLDKVTDGWFYSNANALLRFLQIYVKGDMIVLLPLWFAIIITGFFDWRFMLIEIGVYLGLRGIGEMIYWFLQQFGKQEYRPENPFTQLGNNGVYIIFQLLSMVNAMIGICLVIFTIVYIY